MSIKRDTIDSFKQELKERNADSLYTNQFLYNELLKQAKWLIRREISAGRIWRNNSYFQTIPCIDVIETSPIDECCPVKTNCKIYRTKNKIPTCWINEEGPIIRYITSVDSSTEFFFTTAKTWQSKRKDPYQKMSKEKYAFFANDYLWFPEWNPHKINLTAFFFDDVATIVDTCEGCEPNKDCIRFLDTQFMLPDYLEAEMFSKALQLLLPEKRIPFDTDIDKDPNKD